MDGLQAGLQIELAKHILALQPQSSKSHGERYDCRAVVLAQRKDRRLMVRGPGRALRARQRLPGHNQGCLCCAPPQSRSAWRFDPDALKKSGDDDDDGT